jgi:hypothetical protein
MSKMTQQDADAATPRDKPYKLWDGEGLFLRVATSGTKSWHLRWESGGRERLKVLGRHPSISLEDARRLAGQLRPPMRQQIAVENDIRKALGDLPKTDQERFEAIMSAAPEPGKHIYFIQVGDSGPFKIGLGSDPKNRLSAMQVSNFEKLFLRAAMPGSVLRESLIHYHFAEEHAHGGWFMPSKRILEFVAAL